VPANLNAQVLELLAWHSHAAGGVHVPFQQRQSPLGQVIETGLIRRLRSLATEIANDSASRPRWIFLVGGPGNGKSETVQDFLVQLDGALGMGGALAEALRERFSRPGLLPRKVEIGAADFGSSGARFAASVGRLVVVQDATATESAMGNAARELADDLADLLTSPEGSPVPVFVACANRGLLARAMNEAVRAFGNDNEVTQLVANVIQASSLGPETLAGRRQCWPLEPDDRFACWPLDVESLLAPSGDTAAPFELILDRASAPDHWEIVGRCKDCTSRNLCPFRQSAEWLRDLPTRANLLTFLRRGELARGQQWNFRGAFSLAAELLVGQWSDFEAAGHPCEWVHGRSTAAAMNPPDAASVLALALQIYPHALFKGGYLEQSAKLFLARRAPPTSQSHPLTHAITRGLAEMGEEASAKPIRETLARDYTRLDPASSTPVDAWHPLRVIEDSFSQSVEQGRSSLQLAPPSASEDRLFALLEKAEAEWNLLGRDSAVAVSAVCLLRKFAAMIAKRSTGLRLGHHALDEFLGDYEASLRDAARLGAVRGSLQLLLGESAPRFNLLEILGQPTSEVQPLVSLQGPTPGIRPVPAPLATASTPGHDMPCIEFSNPVYRIPLTFDFFMALRLRKDGCAGSSLPASVRAALDRIRHRLAGELCRTEGLFLDGRVAITLAGAQRITVPIAGGPPALIVE